MFSRLKSFIYNHQKKFIVGGVLVGGTVAIYHLLKYRIEKWQEDEMKAIIEKVRKERHFETVDKTCSQTILDISRMLNNTINEVSDIDNIVATLRSHPSKKVTVWQQLKVATFAHLCLVIYTETLLVVLLRIQLGVIGGHSYKTTVCKENSATQEMQEKYLSLYMHFLKNGLQQLYDFIEEKVTTIVSTINLSDELTVQRVQEIFWSIQTALSNESYSLINNLHSYLQVDSMLSQTSNDLLKQLLSETVDILRSDDVTMVLYSSIHGGFLHFTDRITERFQPENEIGGGTGNNTIPFTKFRPIQTAKLIPIMRNVLYQDNANISTSWLKNLMLKDKISIISANVYEAYCI